MLYLAKSNRADPKIVQRVREVIHMTFPSEPIISYNPAAGSYSNEDLLKCDTLVVIPEFVPKSQESEDSFVSPRINLGKGLYNQITDFSKITGKIFVVGTYVSISSCVGGISPLFTPVSLGDVKRMKVTNERDYIRYGYLSIDDESMSYFTLPYGKYKTGLCVTNAFNRGPIQYYKFQGCDYKRVTLYQAIDYTGSFIPNNPTGYIAYQQPSEDQLREIREARELIDRYYRERLCNLSQYTTNYPVGMYTSYIPNKYYKTMEARREYWLSRVF